jgi:hypothetical protein
MVDTFRSFLARENFSFVGITGEASQNQPNGHCPHYNTIVYVLTAYVLTAYVLQTQ